MNHDHCRYCGRKLEDVEELDTLHDPVTGERRLIVWRQCPKFPRNGWRALFSPGLHDSFQRDAPICARAWL